MAKRVFEIAKELGVKSKAILLKCEAEGIPGMNNHMSSVSAGLEATIRDWFSEGAGGTAVETAAAVDLDKVRVKPRAKAMAKPKAEPAPVETPDAPEADEAPVETPEAPTAPAKHAAQAKAAPKAAPTPAPTIPSAFQYACHNSQNHLVVGPMTAYQFPCFDLLVVEFPNQLAGLGLE